MSTHDRNQEKAEWRLLLVRRMTYALLLLAAVAAGVWFVRWVSGSIGMDRIGEHYKQADDY